MLTAHRSLARSAVLATVATALLVSTPAAHASAADLDDSVTWGVRTASNDFGESRENFTYDVEPGGSLDDAFVVTNYDDEPLQLTMYAADGFTTSSGQLDVATRDVLPREIGAWVAVEEEVVIEPGESREVPFTLDVPDNATPGDHAGAIVTSLTVPAADEGISVDRRLGIRIYLRVGGDLAPSLSIDAFGVEYSGSLNPFVAGTASASYTIRNTGNSRLDAGHSVTLAGPFGLFRGAPISLDDVPQLLPGESWEVDVPLTSVVPLFLVTAEATVNPALPDGTGIAPASAQASFWAVPWTLLIAAVLAVASIVLVVWTTRRGRRKRKAVEDARVQQAVELALREREQVPG